MEGGNGRRGGGGGRGRGRGRDGNEQGQGGGAAGGGGRGSGSHRGGQYGQPPQQQWGDRPRGTPWRGPQQLPFQQPQAGGASGTPAWGPPQRAPLQQPGGAPAWGGPQRAPFQQSQPQPSPQRPPLQHPRGGAQGADPSRGQVTWTGRPWSPVSSSSSPSPSTPPVQIRPQPMSIPPVPVEVGVKQSFPESSKNNMTPIKRPDIGTIAIKKINLLVNHFPVKFNPNLTIIHYDVDVKQVRVENEPTKKTISKFDLAMIKQQLFGDNPRAFPVDMSAYDGEKNIFSVAPLPTGEFKVVLSGDGSRTRTYMFTIKLVAELKLSKLKEYLSGSLSHIPREILQAMDLVMKDNPSKTRIPVGKGKYYFSRDYRPDEDFGFGVAAYRGYQHTLKPTSQGLALVLDYSVLAFRKPMPVLEFLQQYIGGFRVDHFDRFRPQVEDALIGLKVHVTHRKTKQKYVISKLSQKRTRDITFEDGDDSSSRVAYLVDYFREKYGKEIVNTNIPCLDIGRDRFLPMEVCVLVEGQIFPKEDLDRDTGIFLKKLSLPPPHQRQAMIREMVQAQDGPSGEVSKNFGIEVNKYMTPVTARVLPPPQVKLGGSNRVPINDKCQWNLVGKSVVNGTPVERWALVDFSSSDRYNKLRAKEFIANLRQRCRGMGIPMEEPLVYHQTGMHDLNFVTKVENVFERVVEEASRKTKGKLQMIMCAMAAKHNGYKYVKWVSETKIGVVTQCFLTGTFNKGRDQDLANLCKKINAKMGGSNFELVERLPLFHGQEHVMFIGADVNHPAAKNFMCPSIAAVVATVNFPAANRYAARVCPQNHRTEKILNFGSMCADLVQTYAKMNSVRPSRIIVFRDGVSEGQFDMVLNEEMIDLMKCVHVGNYQPRITLVVAQKRHSTRLFLERGSGNVPPGTVVDTTVVHPNDFDFYLCSHFGGLGTSKPTHYYVLWDENHFTSDSLQKLIYDLCFTFARCAKAVSLVPPVFYADLVAYRGRMFQEVLKEKESSSSSSTSAASSSSSSSAALSFQQQFYNLHPDLKDIMFFV